MKFKRNSLFIFLSLFIASAASASLNEVRECLDDGYHNIQGYNSIVAAVITPQQTEILTFGNGEIDQIFEIGSITKTFTGILLAQAVEDNLITVDDFIPAKFQVDNSTITYKQLTTHTSGLPASLSSYYEFTNRWFPWEGLTKAKLSEIYPKIKLDFDPGSSYAYSNLGVSVLGLSLEEVYKKDYENLVQEKIFQKLGMNESFFEVPFSLMHRFKQGNVNGDIWPYWDLFKTATNSAGGIRSTITDMAKFVRANLDPRSSSMKDVLELSHHPLYKSQDKWIGMNWMINPNTKRMYHDGSTIAFNSLLLISKEANLAVIVLTDTGIYDKSPPYKYDFTFMKIASGCMSPERALH